MKLYSKLKPAANPQPIPEGFYEYVPQRTPELIKTEPGVTQAAFEARRKRIREKEAAMVAQPLPIALAGCEVPEPELKNSSEEDPRGNGDGLDCSPRGSSTPNPAREGVLTEKGCAGGMPSEPRVGGSHDLPPQTKTDREGTSRHSSAYEPELDDISGEDSMPHQSRKKRRITGKKKVTEQPQLNRQVKRKAEDQEGKPDRLLGRRRRIQSHNVTTENHQGGGSEKVLDT